MGKFSKSQSKGVMLSSWGNKNYYKGKGVNKAGVTTRKGGFRLVDEKMPHFVVPQFISPDLRPYVSRRTPLVRAAPPAYLSEEEIERLFQQQLAASRV
jgi:large subunit ribosomal protein L41